MKNYVVDHTASQLFYKLRINKFVFVNEESKEIIIAESPFLFIKFVCI